MKTDEYRKIKKMLVIGIIAAFVTVTLGEMPIGWTVYPNVGDELLSNVIGFANMTIVQYAFGVLFGGIGIALQYFGFKAIAEIIGKSECKRCARLIDLGAKSVGFWGAVVHILCVAFMFVCNLTVTPEITEIPKPIWDFALWLVLPITVVFMLPFMMMAVAMFIAVLSGKTILPKWAAVFNPMIWMMVFNSLVMTGINTKFINGLRMSNIGLSSLIIFTGVLVIFTKKRSKIVKA